GWEVRGAIGNFKAIIGTHDMTTIRGKKESRSIDVLEGFTDYLTKEQMQEQQPDETVIILNSAAFAKRAINKILTDPKFANVELTRLWFDNDKRGEEITQEFITALMDKCNVGDMRDNYNQLDEDGKPYNDLNRYWTDCPGAKNRKPDKKIYYETW